MKLKKYWTSALPADIEWIVVDNASTDSTVETAQRLGASVVSLDTNVGFSAANNIGLARASGTYVGFVNPDASVAYDTLTSLADVIDSTGGLVAPQLVNDDKSPQPNGRGLPRIISKINNRIKFSELLRREYTLYADDGETKNVFWITGAAICASKKTFDSLGGWNEKYFLYFEDIDLCCRAHMQGVPVVVYGGAQWVHGWARDTASLKLGPWMHELRSALRFYRTYPSLVSGLFVDNGPFSSIHANSNAVWAESQR